ncbi:MAG: SNF1-interacting protein [Pycnora praestabilis]|nr:MAG: SNF1-interacting protein [Pycnora praestabilis]
MADNQKQPALEQVGRPLSLIPVGLKEAALDSPTFRATTVHFSDQVDFVERWLEGYVKSTSKLSHEASALESLVNGFLSSSTPPPTVSEAILDHDYTLLALKRYGEGAREFWSHTISGMKKMDVALCEPIKGFLQGELRNFKEARRQLEQAQKQYDNVLSRHSSQAKTKEASSLREDAFQLHEARKLYLKTSMDFCTMAPQLRSTLDKLLVGLFSDQWRDMKTSRETLNVTTSRWGSEMERVRGWSKEMESGERAFKRELQVARKQIEDSAEAAIRPSRELEDYSNSTVPYLGTKGPSTSNLQSPARTGSERSEKQGWLFQRTLTGKPARTVWVRRWFFVKNGIFGWLIQGTRSGGVEESDRIGVLLCSVRPAFQEERRFCFEVKTKDHGILLQAETQSELLEWIGVFDVAKGKALEDPASTDSPTSSGVRAQDAAFAISPPSAPEFAAKISDSYTHHGSDELVSAGLDRTSTLPVPDRDGVSLATRNSFDVTSPRRSTFGERDGDSSRDHAARIIQKLDLHRKSTVGPQLTSVPGASSASSGPSGGIASLISASHNILPVGPGVSPQPTGSDIRSGIVSGRREPPPSSLAPSTLANPPTPTNLSKAAVIVSGERGIGVGRTDGTGGTPSGLMANLWGSTNWGYINRLERGEVKPIQGRRVSNPPSPMSRPSGSPPTSSITALNDQQRASDSIDDRRTSNAVGSRATSPSSTYRQPSLPDGTAESPEVSSLSAAEFPASYPVQLKTQDAQFRMLFPNVRKDEKVVLVFRATWNPNEQQEFPGRVYVTVKDIFFYSHHYGLVLISGLSLDSISGVTAAPGRDCDFLYLHLKEGASKSGYTRLTIKVFLEPLRLLQRRLSLLVQNCNSENSIGLEAIMNNLLKMDNDDAGRTPSLESWEDVSLNTPVDEASNMGATSSPQRERDLRAKIRIDRGLFGDQNAPSDGKEVTKFKLPSKPVKYSPQGMEGLAVEKEFEISPKALFHVMFGDKSAVFQLLYHQRRAQQIHQGPWIHLDQGHLKRNFNYQIDYLDIFRRSRQTNVIDHQLIDVLNDHLCYVITDKKTPWHLPHKDDFMLLNWFKTPTFSKGLVEKQAHDDMARDALDLAELITDQVRRLGPQSRTKKAIHIFGHIGHQSQSSQLAADESHLAPISRKVPMRQRTLTHMLLETFGSLAESTVSSLMLWTFALLKKIWTVSSANALILSLLALSVFVNMFYSSRDTSEWWSDRSAGKFMARIGVGPNPMMSKAVYLRDIDSAVSSQTGLPANAGDKCYSTFRSLSSFVEMDAPYQSASAAFSQSLTKATARRLRRTRQHLGAYRHDLLVAMRVVNSIEREMLTAEWENWLIDENIRCKQVDLLINENGTSTSSKRNAKGQESPKALDAEREGRLQGIRESYEDYCHSCRREQGMLMGGSAHLSFT